MIEKIGSSWKVNGKQVTSYELYAVYGASISKRPGQITEADVQNFLLWQKNPNRMKESLGWKGDRQ